MDPDVERHIRQADTAAGWVPADPLPTPGPPAFPWGTQLLTELLIPMDSAGAACAFCGDPVEGEPWTVRVVSLDVSTGEGEVDFWHDRCMGLA